jgi:hypothetical protein
MAVERAGRGERREERRHPTHPERLLGEKIRMATPRPQTTRAETARGVTLGPRETCTGPLRAHIVLPMFPRVECELLVVCYEFERDKRERRHR